MLGKWLAFKEQHGGRAQGIFFRRRYKQLDRVRDRGKQIYIPSGARFLGSKDEYRFLWPDGASLRLRHLQTIDDAEEYQGHEYNFMCVAVGTGVVMGDGSIKAIEKIAVDEMVMTLEGPKNVLARSGPYAEKCVKGRVYDSSNKLLGSQVHPSSHPVLCGNEWLSFEDIEALTGKQPKSGLELYVVVPLYSQFASVSSEPFYLHPYTGEARRLSQATVMGELVLSACGNQYVCDITVEDANHYITETGLINKNCFEELTQWPNALPIDRMRAANRDSQGVPCYFLSTCNPGGPGHQWVKDRYILPNPRGYEPITMEVPTLSGKSVIRREAVYIPAKVWDNRLLLASQPDYIDNLYLSGPEWLVRAWLEGDWDIVAGGYLEGIWKPELHVIPRFVPPPQWPRFRAMDWGFAKPYSIGWYAINPDTSKIIRYRELYGYGGVPNTGSREDALDVKIRIIEAERAERASGIEFRKNPADRSIWNKIGTQMGIEELFRKGSVKTSTGETDEAVKWSKGDNTPGSRIVLNALTVAMLKHEMFQVTEDCPHFLRTVPVIPADDENPEDVDTDAEDHVWDEFKMAMGSRRRKFRAPAAEKSEPVPFSGPWLEGIKDGKYIPPKPASS